MPDHELILIEGLTGCGKSSLAHFVSRQLDASRIPHTWVHEAEVPHPLWPPEELPIADFIQQMPARWQAFMDHNRQDGKVAVVEACYLNNMVEDLFKENLPREEVIAFGLEMQEVIRSYRPALVYLRRGPVAEALKINFADRGEGFCDFVIELTSRTAYSQANHLHGYDGMVRFWEDSISIYEELFERYTIDKLLIETPGNDWLAYNRQALDFLGIPYTPEAAVTPAEAEKYLGSYTLQHNQEEWPLWWDDTLGGLRLDRFILLPQGDHRFLINSHHFEVLFKASPEGTITGFEIGGRDIDYLKLVGVEGIKRS